MVKQLIYPLTTSNTLVVKKFQKWNTFINHSLALADIQEKKRKIISPLL